LLAVIIKSLLTGSRVIEDLFKRFRNYLTPSSTDPQLITSRISQSPPVGVESMSAVAG